MSPRIILFSKEGCHLCERALSVLQDLSRHRDFELMVFDITGSQDLFRKYFLSIPVVEIDGKTVFEASDIQFPNDIEVKLRDIIASL